MTVFRKVQGLVLCIFYDSPPYVDYIKLPDTWNLWRVDGKNKDVAIYDDVLTGSKNHLILVTPRERITIYKGGIWYLDDNIDLLLIRFVNGRYKTGVTKGNFNTTKDIIDYILGEESSLFSQ